MTIYKIIFSICTMLYVFFSAKIFLSFRKNKITTLFNTLFFTFGLITINQINNNHFIFILENIIIILFLFSIFQQKRKIFSVIFIIYIIRFMFEIIFLITLNYLQITYYSTYLLYIFTYILTILLCNTFKEYLILLIEFNNYNNKYISSKSLLNLILIFIIIFLHAPNHSFVFIENKIFYLLFIYIVLNLNISLFIEKQKTYDYIKNYTNIIEYSRFTEDLLIEYKSFIHEYKNKLIIIKGLANINNQELHDYIDLIINEKITNNYYWLMDVTHIPIPGIKGLINYKLLKMKELNINIEVYISEELKTFNRNFLDIKEKNNLYTILGVILDNAIEASIESKEKIISLQLFKDEENIIIILANTFKSINLDKLETKGYSSKGKYRGIGLFLVKNIIKHSKNIEKETNIINNFFVQKIIIKSNNQFSSKIDKISPF